MKKEDEMLFDYLVDQISHRVMGDISLGLASYKGKGISVNMVLKGVIDILNKIQENKAE